MLTVYFGIKNGKFIKAFSGAKNPVIILLHGGSTEPDGMLDYIFEADKFRNIWGYGTNFDVPMYFINGEMDYTCSTNLVKKYYENITAPEKKFYEIKGCGHSPQADKPKEVAKIISAL